MIRLIIAIVVGVVALPVLHSRGFQAGVPGTFGIDAGQWQIIHSLLLAAATYFGWPWLTWLLSLIPKPSVVPADPLRLTAAEERDQYERIKAWMTKPSATP